ncbi:MAG: methyltransferase domain-containing protein [Bacteroidota bacterium]
MSYSTKQEAAYWTKRYEEDRTGWDIGSVSTPIKEYVDQVLNKDLRILIPGAGNAYEAEYLWRSGFLNTHVLDISPLPLQKFAERVSDFPADQLLQANFFELEGQFDLIVEQTFFCSFLPTIENREAYAKKMDELLVPGGKLVGLWFDKPVGESRPFGGSKEEYLGYFEPYFEAQTFERSYNSIKPRAEVELFGIFRKPLSASRP